MVAIAKKVSHKARPVRHNRIRANDEMVKRAARLAIDMHREALKELERH
jgi:hypothetical protein